MSNEWQIYLQQYNECCSTEEMKDSPLCKGSRMKKASELRQAGHPANYYCNLVSENRILRAQVQSIDQSKSSQANEDMLKLQQANYKISKELEAIIEEKEVLIKRLNNLQRECGKSEELSNIIENLKKEKNEANVLLVKTREELKSCLSNQEKFEGIKRALTGENQTLKEELKIRESAVNEYTNKVAVSERRVKEVEERLNKTKSDLENTIEQLKMNSSKLVQLREQDQKSLQDSLEKLRNAEKLTEQYKGATRTARDLQQRLQDKVDRLEQVLNVAKVNTVEKSKDMGVQCEEFKNKNEQLVREISRLQESIKNLESIKDRAVKDHQLCKELLERKEQELNKIKAEVIELNRQKTEVEKAFRENSEKMQKEVSDVSNKLVIKNNITEELQKRNSQLEQEMKNLAAQYKENIISMSGEKSDMIELRNMIKSLQEELSKSKSNKEQLQEDIKQIDRDCKALISDKDKSLTQRTKEYNQSIERINDLQEKIQLLESAKAALAIDLANCNNRLATSAQQIQMEIPIAPPPPVFEIPVAPAFDIPVPPPAPVFDIPVPPPAPSAPGAPSAPTFVRKSGTGKPVEEKKQELSFMEQLAAKQKEREQKTKVSVEQSLEEEKKKKEQTGGIKLTPEQQRILARRAAIQTEEDEEESDEWKFYFF